MGTVADCSAMALPTAVTPAPDLACVRDYSSVAADGGGSNGMAGCAVSVGCAGIGHVSHLKHFLRVAWYRNL